MPSCAVRRSTSRVRVPVGRQAPLVYKTADAANLPPPESHLSPRMQTSGGFGGGHPPAMQLPAEVTPGGAA